MIAFFKNSRKILGMNARNLQFIRPNNLRRAKRLADDKLLSKKFLKKADLPVPNLIAKIKSADELENFDWNILPESFVLKPNRGFGGEGILVVYGKKKNVENTWIKADGSLITVNDIKTHISNILDGSYSLSGVPDIAFFEERLKLLETFQALCLQGNSRHQDYCVQQGAGDGDAASSDARIRLSLTSFLRPPRETHTST